MRPSIAALLLVSACASSQVRNVPVRAGASATDVDRGPGGGATSAGASAELYAIGQTDTGPSDVGAVPPMALPPQQSRTPLVAGPPQTGVVLEDPETLRALQQALADRRYYRGAFDGKMSPALKDALRRFQADRQLPATGQLDATTARQLGVPYPTPPPPRTG